MFYLNTTIWLIVALPTFFMPYTAILAVAKAWGRVNLLLLRVVAGIGCEFRGREKIPQGPIIVAAKHQSAWETFALFAILDDPTYVLKRELMWVPLFGWLARKAGMIPIDRGARVSALARMAARARDEIAHGRQIVIFPEGTRRAPGAEPRYLPGVAYIYAETKLACVPVALNSGLFWPRRSWRRSPGTVLVEVLDPIPPGLDRRTFLARLQSVTEAATARLVQESQTGIRDQESGAVDA